MKTKKTMLTGIQPTGHLMLGNYIGAIKGFVEYQADYESLFMLADLHALTTQNDPQHLLKRCYEFISLYLACGIDPDKSAIFVQSHIPSHSQLAFILNNFVGMGELQRMTQFKDKVRKNNRNINAGLFTYPVLMASDILIYKTDIVPIGDDQRQHLELTRSIAQRLNHRFGEFLTIPEPYLPKSGGRIMSLQEPNTKMSKSDLNTDSYIALLDSAEVIVKKMKGAVTDSDNRICFEPESKPGISNLLTIYSCITGESIDSIEDRYYGKNYGALKMDLADLIIEYLKPIQMKYKSIIHDEQFLTDLLAKGADTAKKKAATTLRIMNKKMGLIPCGGK